MKYIYTMAECAACDRLKAKYEKAGEPYEERNADRLKAPEDDADKEAIVLASLQNFTFPVEVTV